jgi:hypothetical protein
VEGVKATTAAVAVKRLFALMIGEPPIEPLKSAAKTGLDTILLLWIIDTSLCNEDVYIIVLSLIESFVVVES